MGVIDSVIIILCLLFMIIGFVKGFTKQTLSSFAWLIALVSAIFLCKPISSLFVNTKMGISLNENIYSWIASKGGEVVTTNVEVLTNEMLSEALDKMGIPYFLHPFLTKNLDLSVVKDTSIVEFISPKITYYIFLVCSFVIIYLLIFLIVKIISKVLGDVIKNSPFSFIDRILGLIWGFTKSIFVVSILLLLLSLIMSLPIPTINDWVVADMGMNKSGFGIAKFLYEHNPIILIINKFKS